MHGDTLRMNPFINSRIVDALQMSDLDWENPIRRRWEDEPGSNRLVSLTEREFRLVQLLRAHPETAGVPEVEDLVFDITNYLYENY